MFAVRANLLAAVGFAAVLVGCGGAGDAGTEPRRYLDRTFDRFTVTRDVRYRDALVSIDPRIARRIGRPDLAKPRPQPLKLDVYEPHGDERRRRPAVVLVHGGGFGFGSKGSPVSVDLARTFARHGYVAVSIDYRLLAWKYCGLKVRSLLPSCYRAAFAAKDDAKAAVRWLRADSRRFRADPSRISIAGESAGGITAYLVGVGSPGSRGAGDGRGDTSGVRALFSISGGVPNGRFAGAGDVAGLFVASRGEYAYPWSVSSVRALRKARIRAELVTVPGSAHVPYPGHRSSIVAQALRFFYETLDLAHADPATR